MFQFHASFRGCMLWGVPKYEDLLVLKGFKMLPSGPQKHELHKNDWKWAWCHCLAGNPYPSSHNHGSVKNGSCNSSYCTLQMQPFSISMIMGERVHQTALFAGLFGFYCSSPSSAPDRLFANSHAIHTFNGLTTWCQETHRMDRYPKILTKLVISQNSILEHL